jgi:ketosteroid isomerase-like protein
MVRDDATSERPGRPPADTHRWPSPTERARNIAAVWRFYGVAPSDDDTARVPMFAEDAVWHVPGDNPVSDDYRGIAAITQQMADRMQPLTRWEIEPRAVMANRDLVMATVALRGERHGLAIETSGGHVFRFDAEGRIAEAWGFVDDQGRLDVLLSATEDSS